MRGCCEHPSTRKGGPKTKLGAGQLAVARPPGSTEPAEPLSCPWDCWLLWDRAQRTLKTRRTLYICLEHEESFQNSWGALPSLTSGWSMCHMKHVSTPCPPPSNLSYRNTWADTNPRNKHLKLRVILQVAVITRAISTSLLLQPPQTAPAPLSVLLQYQDTFGPLKGELFYALPNETPENAHLKIPFIKPEIYCGFKKNQTEVKFLDKNYSHGIRVVIFYFIFEMKPLYIVQTITTDGINKWKIILLYNTHTHKS